MPSDPNEHRLDDLPVATLAGKTCWVITDGKAGHEAQSLGVAEALGLETVKKPVDPQGLYRKLSPYLPVARAENFGKADSVFVPPWPAVAIGTGRLTAPYLRALKRHAGHETYVLTLLDPKFGYAHVDLIWTPFHDQKSGANIISTLTPPHRFSPSTLALLRTEQPPFRVPENKVKCVVLLGGPNGRYRYSDDAIQRLVRSLRSLVKRDVVLLATASRRTPVALTKAVRAVVDDSNGYFWEGSGENPLPYFYALGDMFVVPADSINMAGEPCVTGRPIYLFTPDGSSEKFSRFHAALSAHGAVRPLPAQFETLETWSYPPLFASDTIAEEILTRWTRQQSSRG